LKKLPLRQPGSVQFIQWFETSGAGREAAGRV